MYCYHKEKRYDSHGNKKKLDKDTYITRENINKREYQD